MEESLTSWVGWRRLELKSANWSRSERPQRQRRSKLKRTGANCWRKRLDPSWTAPTGKQKNRPEKRKPQLLQNSLTHVSLFLLDPQEPARRLCCLFYAEIPPWRKVTSYYLHLRARLVCAWSR